MENKGTIQQALIEKVLKENEELKRKLEIRKQIKENNILVEFEEIWDNLNEKQKKIQLEYYANIFFNRKLEKVKEEERQKIIEEKDKLKERLNKLQRKMNNPLDEFLEGKLILDWEYEKALTLQKQKFLDMLKRKRRWTREELKSELEKI